MKLWFKNFRISVFNWFAAGRMTLTKDKPQEYKPMSDTITLSGGSSTYTLGGLGAGQSTFSYSGAGSGGLYYNAHQPQVPEMNLTASSINFNVAKANGGWIVQINHPQNVISVAGTSNVNPADLYLIHEDEDFDKALGKIITISCLKG